MLKKWMLLSGAMLCVVSVDAMMGSGGGAGAAGSMDLSWDRCLAIGSSVDVIEKGVRHGTVIHNYADVEGVTYVRGALSRQVVDEAFRGSPKAICVVVSSEGQLLSALRKYTQKLLGYGADAPKLYIFEENEADSSVTVWSYCYTPALMGVLTPFYLHFDAIYKRTNECDLEVFTSFLDEAVVARTCRDYGLDREIYSRLLADKKGDEFAPMFDQEGLKECAEEMAILERALVNLEGFLHSKVRCDSLDRALFSILEGFPKPKARHFRAKLTVLDKKPELLTNYKVAPN